MDCKGMEKGVGCHSVMNRLMRRAGTAKRQIDRMAIVQMTLP
jgi:hypothetical protein